MKTLISMLALVLLAACGQETSQAPANTAPGGGAEVVAPAPTSPEQLTRAQAGRSVSPEDAALAEKAGAPLFAGMGDYTMDITTASPDAQRFFNQGMVLAFAFNHAESVRSFQAAQALDPQCAMCFWGEALAIGPNINVTSNGKAIMSAEDRVTARAAIDRALELMGDGTELEQALIKAQSRRYNGDPATERAPLDLHDPKVLREGLER